jgi:hypothetical protein
MPKRLITYFSPFEETTHAIKDAAQKTSIAGAGPLTEYRITARMVPISADSD